MYLGPGCGSWESCLSEAAQPLCIPSPKGNRSFPLVLPCRHLFPFFASGFSPSKGLEASGPEKACIHHTPLPLLPSRLCAKKPPRKDLPSLCSSPATLLEGAEEETFPAHPPQNRLQGLLPGHLGSEPRGWSGTNLPQLPLPI